MRDRAPTLRRLATVAGTLVRYGLILAAAYVRRRRPGLPDAVPSADQLGPLRLRALFEDLGGSFIKFGQMLALQPDLVPRAYCDALLGLLDRVEPFAYADVERILLEELGRGPEELFDRFDRHPLAAASVGQVHVAVVDDRKVAVKVQRPTARAEFGSDVRLFQLAIRTIRLFRLRPVYWLIEPMSEFVRWTREELDYRYEAAYAERLASIAAGNPTQRVPKVYRHLTTRRVLVAEFLEGVTLLDYLRARDQKDHAGLRRLEELGFERTSFARNVVDNFLGDAFRHGIYHADLHPANLMILPNSVVGYVDFGITGVMSAHSRQHLMAMTLALAQGNYQAMYKAYLEITVHDRSSDYEGFREGLRKASAGWYADCGGSGGLAANFTRIMSEMLELSRRNGVMPERDVIKYIRSSIAIDGLITRFVPGFDLGSHLARTCARHFRYNLRRSHLAAPRLADWSLAGAHLAEDGLARVARALGTVLARPPTAGSSRAGRGPRRRALEIRAFGLGAAAFAVSLLAFAAPPQAVGPNLLTAELTVAALALALCTHAVWRLAR